MNSSSLLSDVPKLTAPDVGSSTGPSTPLPSSINKRSSLAAELDEPAAKKEAKLTPKADADVAALGEKWSLRCKKYLGPIEDWPPVEIDEEESDSDKDSDESSKAESAEPRHPRDDPNYESDEDDWDDKVFRDCCHCEELTRNDKEECGWCDHCICTVCKEYEAPRKEEDPNNVELENHGKLLDRMAMKKAHCKSISHLWLIFHFNTFSSFAKVFVPQHFFHNITSFIIDTRPSFIVIIFSFIIIIITWNLQF